MPLGLAYPAATTGLGASGCNHSNEDDQSRGAENRGTDSDSHPPGWTTRFGREGSIGDLARSPTWKLHLWGGPVNRRLRFWALNRNGGIVWARSDSCTSPLEEL